MATRRGRTSGLALLLDSPWWTSALLAVAVFVFARWLLPALTAHSRYLKPAGLALQRIGLSIAGMFALLAVVLWFQQRRPRLSPQPDHSRYRTEPVRAFTITPIGGSPKEIERYIDHLYSERDVSPRRSDEKPTQWSLDLLRRIEWKRFEELCAAYYRETGLRAETQPYGPDGGIDIWLYDKHAPRPVAIAQCKAWNAQQVRVESVRALLGVLTSENIARGFFHCTGPFPKKAIEFVAGNPIDLVDGERFLAMILALPEAARQRLLAVATEGDFATPTCVSCGIKMVRKDGKRGQFWGCPNYPHCQSKRNIKAPEARA